MDIDYAEFIKIISRYTKVSPTARLVLISLLPHIIRANDKGQLVVPIVAKVMAKNLGMTPKNFSNIMTGWEKFGVVERFLNPNQVVYLINPNTLKEECSVC